MEKQKRKTALSTFTRNETILALMFRKNSPSALITTQFNKLSSAWEKLEEAHDNFLGSAAAIAEDDEKYLDAPLV